MLWGVQNGVNDFHHYKGNTLSPSEKVERKVVALLLSSTLLDSKRESSITWELKHSSGCAQIGKVLAQRRGLDTDIAATACVLHDIYVVVEGKYADHARLGEPIAKKILEDIGGFSKDQIDTITQSVMHHSEKEIVSK